VHHFPALDNRPVTDADDPASTSDAAVAPLAAVAADTLADDATIMLLNMMIHPLLKTLIKTF
jgi:hypothetical protein